MSIISRLGKRFREKPKSTNLNLPSLPTPREILEDLESCQNNDPVITLATVIQKKGRQSLLDSDFLDDPNNRKQSQLAFLSPYQIEPGDKAREDAQTKPVVTAKERGGAGSRPSSSKAKKNDTEDINSYNKLKQFLLVHEKSEELLEDLEPHLKSIEAVLKSRDELLTPSSDNVDQLLDKEKDLDVCSSPLM
ncbi:hypothetical protein Ocin01_08371 [Orchesella cincta]|uniref:Uncharacterized protein n=1 Tax=Orchesella cincta TaxID=48709 RepID=A0A1D2MZ34_ORCCI|nr:hypothetical protein Ocin01_08371 [Orchesella cincta]